MATNIRNYIRGDSRTINLTVLQSDNVTPFNLTGATVFFTLNASNAPTDDSAAAVSLDSANNPAQVIINNGTNGTASIKLTNANTQNLTPGTYYYDVEIKDASGNVISLPQGTFQIVADITRRIA